MFGGQRGTSNYLDEAEWLYDVYRPLLSDYVPRMSAFLHRESQDGRVSFAYPKGLDVLTWLTTASAIPDELYLLSIPVCQPLVALIQLMHVMVLYKTLRVSPGDLVRRFRVAVGHSQGIGIAAAVSTLTDEQSFFDVSERVLGIHLLAGAFPQIEFPCYQVLSEPNSNTEPRPMVSVQGITKPALEEFIANYNGRQSSPAEHAYLAVVNTVDQFIVASEVTSVTKLVVFLRSQSADPDQDQSRIPFPKRKPVITVQYTTISAPYHCTLLQSAAEEAYTVAVERGWVLRSEDMQIAVRASDDGHDIRTESDLTQYLFGGICVLPVDWPQATRHPGVTHIVDFGPGGLSGFGFIAYKNIEGMGISVICAGALVSHSSKPYLGSKADLYRADLADVATAPNWLAEFGPKLVRTAHDDQLHIDTPMSRVLGAPTVMVAGMSPTTTNERFVAATTSSWGVGEFSLSDMKRKIDSLVKLVKPGQGITLNCIYIDQRQWSFQYPALLRLVLDAISKQGAPADGNWDSHISLIVSNVLASPIDSKPVRGHATIPLPGIDMPFHSRQLLSGVDEFRTLLQGKIRPEIMDYSVLHLRYVPNLPAVPFEVSREYFTLVHSITQSPVAANVLNSWPDAALDSDDSVTRLAAALLVELLAYQFASPVQWINTQGVLLGKLGVRRLIEVGVSPILSGMAAKTLKSEAFSDKRVEVLHVDRDRDAIYYTQSHEEAPEPIPSALPAQPELPTLPMTTTVIEPAAPVVSAIRSSGAVAALADIPLQALDVVHALVAHKLKRPLADVSTTKSIKALVDGKSTLQNEIVGDLHKEFGSKVPDKAEELSQQDLAAVIGAFGGSLGKHTQAQLARLFSSKMPGGFSLSSTRSILQSTYGLGLQRQDALFLVALTMEPSSRLSGNAEAKAWLGTVAEAYAAKAGISYAAASAGGGSSGQAGAPVISSAEMEKMQQKQHEHIRQQIQVLAHYVGMDLRE
ncbi:hypothetical protein H4S02_004774, partial [Coemansia sp. RSA 2611]